MVLTKSSQLDYTITYEFNVGEVVVVEPSFTTPALAVTGKPSIGKIEYGPRDTFTNKTCTKNLSIDWSNVSFMEPGVYRWPVTKTGFIDESAAEQISNNSENNYLYVHVIDNNGNLNIDTVVLSAVDNYENFEQSNKNQGMEDQYPATTLDLSITKTVTGNQGSKDQYFKFTLTLNVPAAAADKAYTITGLDTSVPATAYHGSKTNESTITTTKGTATIEMWLKHGQTATIKDLIYGSSYTIVESENAGYGVSSSVTGDISGVTYGKETVSDTAMITSTQISYTNEKNTTVPTGIELETAAPIVGMILAMAMLALLFVGKRKEEIA